MKKSRVLYYVAMVVILCLGFFVLGPMVDNLVIVPQMPYLIIDQSMVEAAMTSCDSCGARVVQPIELVSTTDGIPLTGEVKLPVSKVPAEYLPYVHYPASWDKWWNMFNPTNNFAVWFSRVLFGICVLGALGVVAYSIYLYRKKKFKFQRRDNENE